MTHEQAPRERYAFQFAPNEAAEISDRMMRVWIRKPLWFLFALLVMALMYALSLRDEALTGVAFGMLLMAAILYYKSYQGSKRALRSDEERFCETVYQYEVYDRELVLRLFRFGEERLVQRVEPERVGRILDLDGYLAVVIGSTVYPLRTAELAPDSVFFGWMHANPKKVERRPPRRPERWGNALFALSILTLPVSIAAAQLIESLTGYVEQSAWVLFALAPIPIASAVWGLVLRKKGFSGTKNLVVGLIFTLVLCFYGLMFLESF